MINSKKLTREVHVEGTSSLAFIRFSTKVDTDIIRFLSSVKKSFRKLSRRYQFASNQHSGVPQRLTTNRIRERFIF